MKHRDIKQCIIEKLEEKNLGIEFHKRYETEDSYYTSVIIGGANRFSVYIYLSNKARVLVQTPGVSGSNVVTIKESSYEYGEYLVNPNQFINELLKKYAHYIELSKAFLE